MKPGDKVVYIGQAQQRDRTVAQKAYEAIRKLSVDRFAALFRHMLDQVDDALFERADKASDMAQGEFFAAMRQIRLSRRELEAGFRGELQTALGTFWSDQKLISSLDSATQAPGEGLALVDNEMLERSIALDGMVSKARAHNAEGLRRLLVGLAALCSHRRVDEDNNPLDPRQITTIFARCSDRLDLNIEPRLIFYKLFERHVLGQLPGLLDEIDQICQDAGIETVKKPAVPRRSAAPPEVRDSAASSVAGTHHDESSEALVQMLHGLLANRKYGAPSAHWDGTGYSSEAFAPASVPDLVAALSRLQRHEPEEVVGDGLKASLGIALQQHVGSKRVIARAEDDTIDIVEMLFDAILGQPALSSSLKALIGRLQIPVVKVALLDRSLFAKKSHPARRLINELAQAALGWVEPEQPTRDPLYRQIERVVERVLNEFEDDISLFSELLDEFLAFRDEERERARLTEERTRQAAEGKARVDSAKARVAKELELRVGNRRVPEVVASLLHEAWSKVLFITLLKEGDDSDAWRAQLGLVDRLLWSVEPKVDADQRKELLVEIPALLSDLREGLNGILFNPLEMTRLFKALEAEHIRCLSAAGRSAPQPQPVKAEPVEREEQVQESFELLDEAEQVEDDGLDEFRLRIQEAPIGTWFEFRRDGEPAIRAKLSARLSEGKRLIFVNRSGFKSADKMLDEVAAELRDGKIMMLDDDLLFERALETVVANLRDMRMA
mgnify:FL=1